MKLNSQIVKLTVVSCVCAALSFYSSKSHADDARSTQLSNTIVTEGSTLKLVGSGIREFLFFDIYRMDAYSESGRCDASGIVGAEETKHLRLIMIREISKSRMQKTASAPNASGARAESRGPLEKMYERSRYRTYI